MAHGEIHVELAVNYAADPKVAALARFGKEARLARDLYVQMVCYAKANMTDGFVPTEIVGQLAYPDVPRSALRQAGFIADVGLTSAVDGGWHITAYLKRNKSRAEVIELSEARAEAGRVGGKRSGLVRKKEANGKQNEKVASVCLNTESETESKSDSETSKPPTPTESRPPQGTRIPDPFVISDDMKTWALSEGITPAQARASTERFCDYWRAKPGKDGRKTDWPATWRNWLRRDFDRHPTPQGQSRNAAILTANMAAAQAFDERAEPDRKAIS